MNAMLSAKGRLTLPARARKALGVKAGSMLKVEIEHGGIRLSPKRPKRNRLAIQHDPVTGLPFFAPPKGTPTLTLAMVKQALRDFP